jgi:hypothetical protein
VIDCSIVGVVAERRVEEIKAARMQYEVVFEDDDASVATAQVGDARNYGLRQSFVDLTFNDLSM